MRKLIVILIFLLLIRCTVSMIYVKNSDDVRINQKPETDVDLRKKDSIGIDLSKDRSKDNEY